LELARHLTQQIKDAGYSPFRLFGNLAEFTGNRDRFRWDEHVTMPALRIGS